MGEKDPLIGANCEGIEGGGDSPSWIDLPPAPKTLIKAPDLAEAAADFDQKEAVPYVLRCFVVVVRKNDGFRVEFDLPFIL